MRISDWSSDVCSSDLSRDAIVGDRPAMHQKGCVHIEQVAIRIPHRRQPAPIVLLQLSALDLPTEDRKSVGKGKSVSVGVNLGVRGVIKKKKKRLHESIEQSEKQKDKK